VVWVVLGCSVLLAGCSPAGPDKGTGASQEIAPPVEALPARFGSLPLEEALSGVVRARNQVSIRPEISATVVEVLVRNGDKVVREQPLVRLDESTAREQLRQSEASARLAEATAAEARARVAEIEAQVKRTRALARDALVSELELETKEAQLQVAEAQASQALARVEQTRAGVEEQRAALDKLVVRAPSGGRVGQRDVEVGMVVNPGSTLFLLGDFNDLVVEVPLTQRMLGHISEGTPVEVNARDRGGEVIPAAISRISPFLEESSFSTTAEIDVPGAGAGLRPGMFVTVRVLYGASQQATLVPTSALWEDPSSGAQSVFVVVDAAGLSVSEVVSTEIPEQPRTVRMQVVELLAEGRGRSGVRGIDEGEWVITLGQHLLHQAMQVGDVQQVQARVRPTTWRRVLELQQLQREDLLEGFLAKQQSIARVLGAEMPSDIAEVDEIVASSPSAIAPVPSPQAAKGS